MDRVVAAFERFGHSIDPRTGMAKCPAHDDSTESLHVTEAEDGRVLFNCFADCPTERIIGLVGLTWPDVFNNEQRDRDRAGGGFGAVFAKPAVPSALPAAQAKAASTGRKPLGKIVATYRYTDEQGRLLYEVLRYDPKEFRQRRPDPSKPGGHNWSLEGVRRVLYQLPSIIEAAAAGELIVFVEGEKDVHTLESNGWRATTSAQGVKSWSKTVDGGSLQHLAGANVVVWPDNDRGKETNAGLKFGAQMVNSLLEVGAIVHAVIVSADGLKDATDHFDAGGDMNTVITLAAHPDNQVKHPGLAGLATPAEWAARVLNPEVVAPSAPVADVVSLQDRRDAKAAEAGGGSGGGAGSGGGGGGGGDGLDRYQSLPTIPVKDMPHGWIVEQLTRAVQAANTPPVVFQRAGSPVQLRRTDENTLGIVEFDRRSWAGRISQVANPIELRPGKGPKYVTVPLELADNSLRGDWQPWPWLYTVTRTPVVHLDESGLHLRTEAGYDAPTRSWYEPLIDVPEVSAAPTDEEIDDARELIDELLQDFPFASGASKAHAVAMLFTPFFADMFEGIMPMFVIRAPKQGSGKSVLAELASLIHMGTKMKSATWSDNDEELAKNMTALLSAGHRVITFDNVRRALVSGTMAALLTTGSMTTRQLGHNDRSLEVQCRSMFIATGNNMRWDNDFGRRVAAIVLEAKTNRPELRSFRIPDMTGFVLRHRGRILHALLTLMAGWAAAGQPADGRASGRQNAQYVRWLRVVGGLVAWCGFVDGDAGGDGVELPPLLSESNTDGALDDANEEEDDNLRLLNGLWVRFGSGSFTWQDLQSALDDQSVPANRDLMTMLPPWLESKWRRRETRSMSHHLASIRDAWFGEVEKVRLVVGKDRMKRNVYQVVSEGVMPAPGGVLGIDVNEF